LLHKPDDSIDLAQKLSFLLRNADLREQMSKHARQSAWENFSSERLAAATLEVFQRLC
jgi:glycosyltransferase involved in cell wall biosynthesis